MKRLPLILSTVALGLFGCTEDTTVPPAAQNAAIEEQELELTIEEKQNATLFFYTSTECPGCGSWGGPTFSSLMEDHKNSVTAIAVHIKYGDPYITSTSEAIAANRKSATYTPQIHVDDENMVVMSKGRIDSSASVTLADNSVEAIASASPQVSCGSVYEIDENRLVVKYGAEFHHGVTGAYFVAAYLLEDGLFADQAGGVATPFRHDNVIRLAITENPFGDLIKDGAIVSGGHYERQTEVTLDPSWNAAQLKIATIVWREESGHYWVINSSSFQLQ